MLTVPRVTDDPIEQIDLLCHAHEDLREIFQIELERQYASESPRASRVYECVCTCVSA
jgi:hypothetical protein